MDATRNTEKRSKERGRNGVCFCRNDKVVVVQKGGRKREFSSWVGITEKRMLVGWDTVLVIWAVALLSGVLCYC